ncbi:MAG: hypothetical protein RLY41_419 [Pseudomonadota bacterium]|jgi:hypothetical protein
MSHEHDETHPAGSDVSDEIKSEASPFEPGFQPESLPKISVPDIPEDAVGLSAEALAQVPTLTEQVGDTATIDTVSEPVADEINSEVLTETEIIQEAPVETDTGGEELHVRMDKLTDQIQALNARLDRLSEKIQIEV